MEILWYTTFTNSTKGKNYEPFIWHETHYFNHCDLCLNRRSLPSLTQNAIKNGMQNAVRYWDLLGNYQDFLLHNPQRGHA